ncbi:hypothetical protein Ciccas_011041 [Cichlidogyrus casuarinus]|uniref:Uncharacterized protein n=1 Tax=Cichlidogyrus casuarinus TaxID=1844966 RepID=A0ABD2PSE0_9PLAT
MLMEMLRRVTRSTIMCVPTANTIIASLVTMKVPKNQKNFTSILCRSGPTKMKFH